MDQTAAAPLHLNVGTTSLCARCRNLPIRRDEILAEVVDDAFRSGATNIFCTGEVSKQDLLEAGGYRTASYYDLTRPVFELDDGIMYVRIPEVEIFARNPLTTRDVAMARALTRIGVPAIATTDGIACSVRLTGGQWVPESGIACAREIEVLDPQGNVIARPDKLILLGTAEDVQMDGKLLSGQDDGGHLYLYAVKGTVSEVLEHIRTAEDAVGYYACVADYVWSALDHYCQPDTHAVSVDALAREMITTFVRALMPDQLRDEERYNALLAVRDGMARVGGPLHDLRSALRDALGRFPELSYLQDLETLISQFERLDLHLEQWDPISGEEKTDAELVLQQANRHG